MKRNLEQNFLDCFGNPITEKVDDPNSKTGKKDVPLLVSVKLARMLFNLASLGGSPLKAEQKYTAYSLSCRIAKNPKAVELSAEECAFIKGVCEEQLSAGAYGFVCDIIEEKKLN